MTLEEMRKYLSTKYDVERESSIEFENLMDDNNVQDEMSKLVSEREKQLLSSKQYQTLVQEQTQKDAELHAQLRLQEEELRREEEAYYEAKREATRIAKLHKAKEENAKTHNATVNGPRSWLGDDETEWEVAGGEDDFEMFLESVRARSLKATSHLRQGSNDGQSSNSSTNNTHTRDRSHTEGSSIDLEWEHEEGVVLHKKKRSSTEENLMVLSKKSTDSPNHSTELEWDNDFLTLNDKEKQQLLGDKEKFIDYTSR
ncbi:hypothetical protein CHS0354_033241 [Potamilus streckersoni]|uniref:Uncharacterized protein n=1 Tax=Potamilus streckersoni TaxID=2493646 RepID=A0AAE0S6W2_9BIVA|nr:hypothetical protein CHS0354_033241 [Potamilus streckersoni]